MWFQIATNTSCIGNDYCYLQHVVQQLHLLAAPVISWKSYVVGFASSLTCINFGFMRRRLPVSLFSRILYATGFFTHVSACDWNLENYITRSTSDWFGGIIREIFLWKKNVYVQTMIVFYLSVILKYMYTQAIIQKYTGFFYTFLIKYP